jgi:hypothetical protein
MKKGALLILFLAISPAFLQAQELDSRITSMFVFNFTKYIEWPAGSLGEKFIIGVVGNPGLTTGLNKIVGSRTAAGKPILVKPIDKNAVQDAGSCQILIFGSGSAGLMKSFTEALQGKHILLVTEKEAGLRKGVGINLILDEDDDFKTKFMLNKTAIETAGLKVSSSLVGLSKQQ